MKKKKKNNALEKAENIINQNKNESIYISKNKDYLDKDFSNEVIDRRNQNFSETYGYNNVEPPTNIFGKNQPFYDPYMYGAKEYIPLAEESKQQENQKQEQTKSDYQSIGEEKKGDRKRKSIKSGLVTAVVSLAIATVILSSVLTYTLLIPSTKDNMLEASYKRSFYDMKEQVNNIDSNMSKVIVTKDGDAMSLYLVDIAIESELAERDIEQLPLQDENKFYTSKLINQIGDYAKYLNKKLINGESITSGEMENLKALYLSNNSLNKSLNEMESAITNDYSFTSLLEGKKGDVILSGFSEMQNLSVEYPKLIYDGPFSDSREGEESVKLSGEVINEKQAKEIFMKAFSDYKIKDIEVTNESNGSIACYNLKGKIDGEDCYCEITKVGGNILLYSHAGSCQEVKYDRISATNVAKDFLKAQGIENMEEVWVNLSNNVYTINLAYSVGNVVFYPDLIKVRVCAEENKVIGIESTSYLLCHRERKALSPTISKASAREKVSSKLVIDGERLAVIPMGKESEKLCYEFTGMFDNSRYYVYIDSKTGKQVEMFRVVDTNNGELLI